MMVPLGDTIDGVGDVSVMVSRPPDGREDVPVNADVAGGVPTSNGLLYEPGKVAGALLMRVEFDGVGGMPRE